MWTKWNLSSAADEVSWYWVQTFVDNMRFHEVKPVVHPWFAFLQRTWWPPVVDDEADEEAGATTTSPRCSRLPSPPRGSPKGVPAAGGTVAMSPWPLPLPLPVSSAIGGMALAALSRSFLASFSDLRFIALLACLSRSGVTFAMSPADTEDAASDVAVGVTLAYEILT